jgi:hypothetical protein
MSVIYLQHLIIHIDITSITGTGTDCIKSIIISTNFYRKIKQGFKVQHKVQESGTKKEGLSALMKPKNQVMENFSIKIPSGAKVIGIAGSGDVYLRSIFTYYKV